VEVPSWCGCFILGLSLFGDGLRDLLDPKMQSVRSAAHE
jgi:ABC-type dipeptide/oligopeptide/nickel transport system permease subunit